MGICRGVKIFEIDKKQCDLILGEDEYFIDMENDSIVDCISADRYINNAISECDYPVSFVEMAHELGLVSSCNLEDWCYGIDSVDAYKTTHGDYVCVISYAY